MSITEQNGVYASEETRAGLGWIADRLGVWTGMPTVVITPNDVEDDVMRLRRDRPDEYRDQVLRGVLPAGQGVAVTQQHVQNAQGFPGYLFQEKLDLISRSAQEGSASAYAFPLRPEDGANGAAIITTMPLNQSRRGIAAGLSGLSESDLENVPGTDQEWRAFVMMHEARHTHQPSLNGSLHNRLHTEADADDFAIRTYRQERALGNVSTPDVPQAFMAMRALGAWSGRAEFSHVTGAMVQSPDEHAPPTGNNDEFADGLHAARQSVWQEMGADLVSQEDRQKAIREMMRRGEMTRSGGTVDEIVARMSPEEREKYDERMDAAARVHGIRVGQEQPELLYETTRRQFMQGRFNDNPIGQQYAWEYLEAARRYAPTHFGVDPSQAPIPEPQRSGADFDRDQDHGQRAAPAFRPAPVP